MGVGSRCFFPLLCFSLFGLLCLWWGGSRPFRLREGAEAADHAIHLFFLKSPVGSIRFVSPLLCCSLARSEGPLSSSSLSSSSSSSNVFVLAAVVAVAVAVACLLSPSCHAMFPLFPFPHFKSHSWKTTARTKGLGSGAKGRKRARRHHLVWLISVAAPFRPPKFVHAPSCPFSYGSPKCLARPRSVCPLTCFLAASRPRPKIPRPSTRPPLHKTLSVPPSPDPSFHVHETTAYTAPPGRPLLPSLLLLRNVEGDGRGGPLGFSWYTKARTHTLLLSSQSLLLLLVVREMTRGSASLNIGGLVQGAEEVKGGAARVAHLSLHQDRLTPCPNLSSPRLVTRCGRLVA